MAQARAAVSRQNEGVRHLWQVVNAIAFTWSPRPPICNLGNHTLVITNDYGNPDASALVTPVIKDGAAFSDEEPTQETIILDHDEAYNLYQCLHALFFGAPHGESTR